jgi:hypothetical protein
MPIRRLLPILALRFVVAACMFLIWFCSLLQHVCFGSGVVYCSGMSVSDTVLFVVATCMF